MSSSKTGEKRFYSVSRASRLDSYFAKVKTNNVGGGDTDREFIVDSLINPVSSKNVWLITVIQWRRVESLSQLRNFWYVLTTSGLVEFRYEKATSY